MAGSASSTGGQDPLLARKRQRETSCKQKAGRRAPAGTLPTRAPGRNDPVAVSRDAESKPLLSRPRTAAGFAASISGLITLTGWGTLLVPSEPALTHAPQAMQLALRRRSLGPAATTPSPAPARGLLARRTKIVERAWVHVARKAVGLDGQVISQQWLVHTTSPGVPADDRRVLDLVVYGATPRTFSLCCRATLVSPLARTGHRQPGAANTNGAALRVAEGRKRSTYRCCARRTSRARCPGRSAGAGMARLAASCTTYYACGGKCPRPLSAAR